MQRGSPFTTICIAEDRVSCEPALRILIASLRRHSPNLPVWLFAPNATVEFARWCADSPACTLNPRSIESTWNKYDIKPAALLTTLAARPGTAVWIDSDIAITRDIRPLLAELGPGEIAVTEEALGGGHADPDARRTRLWNMPVGRILPFAANTGVIGVTTAHMDLLHAWNELLQSDVYRLAQEAPWHQRPDHLLGDQEVLTALLASMRFAHVPIRFLRRGRDIIQFFGSSGYTTGERLGTLLGGNPYFVHSQGLRPWWPTPPHTPGLSARFLRLYNALSPYNVVARRHVDALVDANWLRPSSRTAKLLTLRSMPLTGLPLALIADGVRLGKVALARVKGG